MASRALKPTGRRSTGVVPLDVMDNIFGFSSGEQMVKLGLKSKNDGLKRLVVTHLKARLSEVVVRYFWYSEVEDLICGDTMVTGYAALRCIGEPVDWEEDTIELVVRKGSEQKVWYPIYQVLVVADAR